MLEGLVLLLGVTIGFVGSRALRRPSNTASAASVARSVGGALGARRGLSLPELQRATLSEMMRHVRAGGGGRIVVPVRYLVQLHPSDAKVVEESPRFFTEGLADALRSAARSHGWTIEGPVTIEIAADSARRPGAPAVLAVPAGSGSGSVAPLEPAPPPEAATIAVVPSVAPAPSAPRPVAGSRPMMLHRLDNGQRIDLADEQITIGRSADRDIVVDDARVSRHHAVVGPHGSGWTVTDARSSNGTRLNGSQLAANQAASLQAGDSIQVGPVTFRFDVDERRIGPEPQADVRRDAATSVLDDATRERISGEYPWPQVSEPRRGPPGADR